jgi:transcription termination factor NusB
MPSLDRLDSDDTSDFVRKEDLESMLHKLRDKIDDDNKELKERINRILLGTDVESIEIVVTQILKQRGVID